MFILNIRVSSLPHLEHMSSSNNKFSLQGGTIEEDKMTMRTAKKLVLSASSLSYWAAILGTWPGAAAFKVSVIEERLNCSHYFFLT